MRSIGTSVSSAVIGMVLANTANNVGGVAIPTMHGFRVSFLIATAAVAVGLLLALFLPGRRPAAHPQLRASSEEDANLEHAEAVLRGFRGRVLDADGAPVARAKVTLIDRRGRRSRRDPLRRGRRLRAHRPLPGLLRRGRPGPGPRPARLVRDPRGRRPPGRPGPAAAGRDGSRLTGLGGPMPPGDQDAQHRSERPAEHELWQQNSLQLSLQERYGSMGAEPYRPEGTPCP